MIKKTESKQLLSRNYSWVSILRMAAASSAAECAEFGDFMSREISLFS